MKPNILKHSWRSEEGLKKYQKKSTILSLTCFISGLIWITYFFGWQALFGGIFFILGIDAFISYRESLVEEDMRKFATNLDNILDDLDYTADNK